jgi:hypothetical protein
MFTMLQWDRFTFYYSRSVRRPGVTMINGKRPGDCIYMYLYGLFNDVSSVGSVAPNGSMVNE